MRRALYLALARCAWGKQMIDKHAAEGSKIIAALEARLTPKALNDLLDALEALQKP